MNVKEIFNAAVALKAEHLEDLIELVQGEVEHYNTQLEERKNNNQGENGNYYLEGLIDGMQQVNQLLRMYNSKNN